MWSNFRDVRSIAEKISNVVAPPIPDHSNNSEEYDDDDDDDDVANEVDNGEEEEYDDEEEINYEQGDQDHAVVHDTTSPFGFVGMLTKAMDQSEQIHTESEESYKYRQQQQTYSSDMLGMSEDSSNQNIYHKQIEIQSDDDEEEIDDLHIRRHNVINNSVYETNQRFNKTLNNHDKSNVESHKTDPEQQNFNTTKQNDASIQNLIIQQQQQQPLSPGQRRQHLPRFDSMDYDTAFPPQVEMNNSSHIASTDYVPPSPPAAIEEPIRFSLVRESGSLSPLRSTKSKMVLGNRAMMMEQFKYSPQQLSSRSLGSTPCGKEVLLSPLRDILQTEQYISDQMNQHNDETVSHDTISVQSDNNKGSESNIVATKLLPRDSLLGSFSVPNEPDEVADDLRQATINDEEGISNDNGIANSSGILRKTNRVDSGTLPVRHRGSSGARTLPTISLETFDENDEGSNSNADSSSSTRHILSVNPSNTPKQNGSTTVHGETMERTTILVQQCKELEEKLQGAERIIVDLQLQSSNNKHQKEYDALMQQFQEKEARVLQAAVEEHQRELQALRYEMNQQISKLQQQLLDERNQHKTEYEKLDTIRSEYHDRIVQFESQIKIGQDENEKVIEQLKQQHLTATRKLEEKVARSMTLLDERDEDVKRLKDTIKQLELKLSEHEQGANEAQEDVDELHNENDILHDHIERLQAEAIKLRDTIAQMEGDSEQLGQLKMELRLLKEEHSREKAKIQTVAASAESSTAQLEAERDEALAKVNDLQIQLSAAIADIEVIKSDGERINQANTNLQSALEAFQSERDAEIAMMEENYKEREQALASKHAAILDATQEASHAEIRQIQRLSDAALANSIDEIKKLNERVESYRLENVQTRRSLDEAIKRLQATQDDVIDRTFMKNILLDWLTKHDRKDKVQVLELMASVLHFTEDEKTKVNLDDGGGLRKFVAPPPPKVNIEALEGDNVREKWVNFLIAEADD